PVDPEHACSECPRRLLETQPHGRTTRDRPAGAAREGTGRAAPSTDTRPEMAPAIRKDHAVPAPHPAEFRRRAVELVPSGVPVAELAKELGIGESCLRNWLAQAEVDDKGSQTHADSRETYGSPRAAHVAHDLEPRSLSRASTSAR